MAAMGYPVTCFNRSGHHVSGKAFDTPKIREYENVRLRNLPTIDRGGLAAVTASFFGAVYTALGRFDVVHFHAEGPACMCWLPKLAGKRVVVTVHGLDHQRAKWGRLAAAYIMLGEKMAVRHADEIIVLSENLRRYFKAAYDRDTRYIPNGIHRPVIREANAITEKYGIKKDGYILFLGRLVPEKGLAYLIEAYKQVVTDKKLVIAGGSSHTDQFARELRERSKDDKRILYTGFVQGRLLEELYSNAYVYVLPSDLEGMPLSLLEAMSYGNCCVTANIPECAEVVEDRAVLFQKGDAADLKEKLQSLLDNPETVRQYREGASDFVCNKYRWDDVVNRTIDLYRGNNGA